MAKGKKNFESSLKELEDIVEKLENGDLTLDESIEYFQNGVKISKDLSKQLDEIEKKIVVLVEKGNGDLEEVDFIKLEEKDGV